MSDYKNNKGCAGGFSIVIGIAFFIISFIAKQGSNSSKGASISSYINGVKQSEGVIGGNRNAVEFFDVLFWFFVIAGIIMVLLGIIFLCSSSNQKEKASQNYNNNNSEMFIKCPNCGEENGSNNEYCYKCKTLLRKSSVTQSTNSWICPKCGKINQNYVGTCGCGETKPK